MLRSSLLVSIAVFVSMIATFAQTSAQRRTPADEAEALANVLRDASAQYTPNHPQVKRSETLIRILETQSKLLQQPASERDKVAVSAQTEALSEQIESLRRSIKTYTPSHPYVMRLGALVEALEKQLKILQQ
jgi:hypothetical protein